MAPEHLDRIIQSLYAGVLAPEGWQDVLDQLRSVTNSEQCTFLVWDKRSNSTAIAEIAKVDLVAIEDYERNFSFMDPGKPAVDTIALGTWHIDARDLGLSTLRDHDFFNLFMRRHGMGSGMCTPLIRNANVLAALSLQTGDGQPHFQPKDAACLAPLMPHLLQAASLRWRYKELSRMAQLGQRVLDHVQSPVLVVDAKANVLFANQNGERWLNTRRVPFFKQAINTQSAIGTQLLQLARKICCIQPRGFCVAGISLELDDASGSTYLIGLPLRESHPLSEHWSQPIGIIVVHEMSVHQTPWPQLLRQLFGLTPTELRMLESLPHHDSILQVATALGITRETARSHLKSIFQKTGIHTQAGLLRLVAQFGQIQ